jgi:phosphopentomutase
MSQRRVVILVLDGVGIGALPDAGDYGDTGSNTLANLAEAVGGLRLPNLQQLGLGNISDLKGCPPAANPGAAFGRMAERSCGKDSTTGHWELSGVVLASGFPRFQAGFPGGFVRRFEAAIGRRVLGNIAISGTEALLRFGAEHLASGSPIAYTSADSVFQLAVHEDYYPPHELYRLCATARELLTGDLGVARVIARPFVGRCGEFRRTPGRRDFSLPPPEPTLLDRVRDRGLDVVLIGKLDELFAGRGFARSRHSVSNRESLDIVQEELGRGFRGLLFANLIQFDMDWGHRNDCAAFHGGLIEFDRAVPQLIERLAPDDLLFMTADHGNDPTTPSTDHSREYVPVLVVGGPVRPGTDLGTRTSLADLGQTAAEYLGVTALKHGSSFLKELTG